MELWNKLYKSVELRLQLEHLYKVEVITASEAQCAEAIIKELYIRRSGIRPEQLRALRTEYEFINVADCITDNIKFKTTALNELLSELKAITLNFKNNVLKAELLKREITIKDKTYALGSGGLHSIDEPGVYTTDENNIIYDIDVTSYYPSIILNMSLHPGHLTSTWTDILREITEERIKAKQSGEKLKADSLKIVINSAYGKTGNQYSFMCDPKLMLTVTITGQLSLLMLVELLSEADIEVISANTDGITAKVKVDQVKEFTAICDAWQKSTGFNLEKTVYKKYIRRDISNYIAELTDGKLKRKGIFDGWNLYKKNDCKIVSKALENYFLKNIPVEETINFDNDQSDIHDYLQSYKSNKGYNAFIDGNKLQKNNRWYISIDGDLLRKSKDSKNIKIKKSGSVKIVNDITDASLPADLDLDFYRQEAKEIIFKIENTKKAEMLKALGLFPIPKEYKYNPKGSRLNEIRTDWNYGSKSGLGVYTGQAAALIAIDIDDPSKVQISHLFSDTMIVYHGQAAPAEVLQAKIKGTLLYKAADLDISSTDGQFLDRYGLEVIYGGKTVQVAGLHPSGEEYKLSGELRELPADLLTWIRENTKKRKRKRNKTRAGKQDDLFSATPGDHPGDHPDGQEVDQCGKELLKKIISDDQELHLWTYREVTGDYYKLQGSCPYEHLHHGESANTQFDIIITDNNTLYAGCFHQSCHEEIKKLNYRLNEKWLQHFPKEKVNLKDILSSLFSGSDQTAEEFKQINEAFKQPGRVKLIAAPTGSGKTYSSVSYFLEKVAAGEHVIYCTSNKTSMAEFVETIEQRTGKKLKQLAIQQLRSGYSLEEAAEEDEVNEDQEAAGNIRDKTIGVITHHTYFSRKGISDLFYSVLTWIENHKAIVIIDEIDSYIQAQSKIISLKTRYKKLKPKGSEVTYYYRWNKCPSFRGKHNCSHCYKGSMFKYEVNSYHIPNFYQLPKVEENEFITNSMKLPDMIVNWKHEMFIPERGLNIKLIEQHKEYLKNKVYKFYMDDNELYNLKIAMADMIECAYNPVIYSYYPMLKDKPITPAELDELSEEDKVKIRYPYMLCDVNYLSLTDLAVPFYLNAAAKEIILLSATVSQSNKNYLKTCFDDLHEINIIESTLKIDELLIIGYGKYFKYIKQDQVLIENLQEFGKVLIFEPVKNEAYSLYKKFPQNTPAAQYNKNDLDVKEKFSETGWKYMISHSRGNIGRAVNLPQFYTCFIDSNIFKPSNAYNLQELTVEEIKRLQQDDRITTTIQNAGRILRGKGRKVIAIAHTEKEEVKLLAEKFKAMVSSEIKTAYYEQDQNVLLRTIENYHKTGELILYPEEKKLDKALKKDLSEVSPKQRLEVKGEYDQVKQQKKIEGKIRLARSLKEEDYTWREIYRTLNLNRFSNEDQNRIKEAIEISE